MFRKQSGETLSLEIHQQSYNFPSPKDFDFALAGRTCVPSSKIAALAESPDEVLLKEAEAIRKVEQRLAVALSGGLEDVTSIGPFLKELDPSIISQDHDWRAIIAALNLSDRTYERFKKIALVKYMQYLTSRQEVVRTLYSNRQRHRQSQDSAEGASSDPKMRETMIFDLRTFNPQASANEFSRVPKGETVEFSLFPEETVEVLLANHRCCIVHRGQLRFIDETGQEALLRPGRNFVGRDAGNDVVIAASLRDVSRRHLILETDGTCLVRITDISSHGTSLPHRFLEITSI
jgi:hypothetical protein